MTASPKSEEPLLGQNFRTGLQGLIQHPEFTALGGWQRRRYAAQDVILREGETSGCVYLVLDGLVRIEGTVRLQSGRQFQAGVTELHAGAVFGELALFDREPHSATVFAASTVELAVINSDLLRRFLDEHREVGYEVYKEFLEQLAPRLRKTTARVYRFLAWGLKAHHLDD